MEPGKSDGTEMQNSFIASWHDRNGAREVEDTIMEDANTYQKNGYQEKRSSYDQLSVQQRAAIGA